MEVDTEPRITEIAMDGICEGEQSKDDDVAQVIKDFFRKQCCEDEGGGRLSEGRRSHSRQKEQRGQSPCNETAGNLPVRNQTVREHGPYDRNGN